MERSEIPVFIGKAKCKWNTAMTWTDSVRMTKKSLSDD